MEVDGNIVFFNEAEAVSDLDAPEPDDLEADSNKKQTKTKGKKEKDMSGFDVKCHSSLHDGRRTDGKIR